MAGHLFLPKVPRNRLIPKPTAWPSACLMISFGCVLPLALVVVFFVCVCLVVSVCLFGRRSSLCFRLFVRWAALVAFWEN